MRTHRRISKDPVLVTMKNLHQETKIREVVSTEHHKDQTAISKVSMEISQQAIVTSNMVTTINIPTVLENILATLEIHHQIKTRNNNGHNPQIL
jgi:hypothetical protein